MKIDIFPHILPVGYMDALHEEMGSGILRELHQAIPTLYELDRRFRIMDEFDGLAQVLTLASPSVDVVGNPRKALELARLANDEMGELVAKYPDRFVAMIASLPLSDMDAALDEADRAVRDIGARGVQIFTPSCDKPLDSPEFMPLYEKMSRYDLPIWLHPEREANYPDYRSEKTSKYAIHSMLGWVYESSVAMVRLVLSGVLERYPNLKFITHHGGAMVPFLKERLDGFIENGDVLLGKNRTENISRPPLDYFRMFYVDTALYGHTPGLMCSYDFYGAGHMLFGTDMPFDSELGLKHTRQTIASIERMEIGDAEKEMIFEGNARSLLHLDG